MFISFQKDKNHRTNCFHFGLENQLNTNGITSYDTQCMLLEQMLSLIQRKIDIVAKALKIISNLPILPSTKSSIEPILDEDLLSFFDYAFLTKGDLTDQDVSEFYKILKEKTQNNYYLRKVCVEKLADAQQRMHFVSKNIQELINGLMNLVDVGQPTYRNIFDSTRGKQKGTIMEISDVQQNKTQCLDLLANLINNDNSLSQNEKDEIMEGIDTASKEQNLVYEIDRWLGKRLTKLERRMLRVLRRIAYKSINQGKFTGSGISLYEIEIPLCKIYEEWGLEKRKIGGYEDRAMKIIKSVLFGAKGQGLYEDILFKHKKIMRTRYILQVEEVYRELKHGKQIEGIRIILPAFLFVDKESLQDKDNSQFFYQDIEGFKRFMKPKGMLQDEYAFELAEYLESLLSSKLSKRLINLDTMISEAGLTEMYKTYPKRAINKIHSILDKMVDAKFIISSWKFDIKGGKYDQGQYELTNTRAQLLTINPVANPSKSKKTTKKLLKKVN